MRKFSWQRHLSTIINLALPARCLSCQKSNYFLCPDCLALIPPAGSTEIPDSEAVFDYQDARIKQVIWQLKYRGGSAIARDLAFALHEHWLETLSEWQNWHPGTENAWLVIPIPITHAREKERGFNQARELARYFVKLNPENLILVENILVKVKDTPSQMKIRNRKERLNNLQNSFAVSENQREKIKNRNILLLDDVITTGATIQEARKTLIASGASSVFGLALAHG